MPKSVSYHPFLISNLQDKSYAALYLETHLEEDEDEFEPELLRLALSHVLEALGESKMSPEQVKSHYKKLDELFAQGGGEAISNLGLWLNALGLKLTVTVGAEPLGVSAPLGKTKSLTTRKIR